MKSVVVQGRLGCRHEAFLFLSLFVVLGVAFSFVKPTLPPPLGDGSIGPARTIAITVVSALTWAVLVIRFLPPTNRIELDDDGVVVDRDQRYSWAELEAFDDGSADYVALVRANRARIRIPTPDDVSRRAVLEALETRLERCSDGSP